MKLGALRKMLRQHKTSTFCAANEPREPLAHACTRCDGPLRRETDPVTHLDVNVCPACDFQCDECKRVVKWFEAVGISHNGGPRLCGSCIMIKR